jgi:hypothetical protein
MYDSNYSQIKYYQLLASHCWEPFRQTRGGRKFCRKNKIHASLFGDVSTSNGLLDAFSRLADAHGRTCRFTNVDALPCRLFANRERAGRRELDIRMQELPMHPSSFRI